MNTKTEQVVSMRVPKGLPEELRQLTGVPFSTLMRHTAILLLNTEREKRRKAKELSHG